MGKLEFNTRVRQQVVWRSGKVRVSVGGLGASAGLMGHAGRLPMSRLLIDVHIAHFILATQYNVWGFAT